MNRIRGYMQPQRAIACTVYDGVLSLDAVGPMQVFASANAECVHQGCSEAYTVHLLADKAGPVMCSAGISLVAEFARDEADASRFDTVLVPGGPGVHAQLANEALITWLQAAEKTVHRLGSVCSGALILAEAGLLTGRAATTHWGVADMLARRYPDVRVEADRIHTYDSRSPDEAHVFTAAGVTSGIDLALALVEADLGRTLALNVARNLVMFLHRPGGQSQFSSFLAPECSKTSKLAPLLAWIPGNLAEDLSMEAMADRADMPPRTFTRTFQRELGLSPAQYVERMRVEAAAHLLAQERASIFVVAKKCGFSSTEILRRAFHKHLGVSPQAYTERFGMGQEYGSRMSIAMRSRDATNAGDH